MATTRNQNGNVERLVRNGPGPLHLACCMFDKDHSGKRHLCAFRVEDETGHQWDEFIILTEAKALNQSCTLWELRGMSEANWASVVITYDMNDRTGKIEFIPYIKKK